MVEPYCLPRRRGPAEGRPPVDLASVSSRGTLVAACAAAASVVSFRSPSLVAAACVDHGPRAWAADRAGGHLPQRRVRPGPQAPRARAGPVRGGPPRPHRAGPPARGGYYLHRGGARDLGAARPRARRRRAGGRGPPARGAHQPIQSRERRRARRRRRRARRRRGARAHGRGARQPAGRARALRSRREAASRGDGTLRRGALSSRAGDHGAARKLFLEAWEAWRPNPRALVEAGLEARAGGRGAEAQALWDRAAYDDATVAIRPELPAGAPPSHSNPALAWAPDGERLAIGGDDEVADLRRQLPPRLRLRTGETVLALAFGVDGSLLFAGLDGGLVRVFDALTGAALRDLAGHGGSVRAIAVSPDARTMASADDDGAVRIWDVAAGVDIRAIRPPRGASTLAFDAAGECSRPPDRTVASRSGTPAPSPSQARSPREAARCGR